MIDDVSKWIHLKDSIFSIVDGRKYYWFSEFHDHDGGASNKRFWPSWKWIDSYEPQFLKRWNNKIFGPNFYSDLQPNYNTLVSLNKTRALERGAEQIIIDFTQEG